MVDETIVFIVVNWKTWAILRYIYFLNNDTIIELYHKILESYNNNSPIIINSDTKPAFTTEKVQEFLNKQELKINVSLTLEEKHQNQVSESINERIKTLVIKLW